MMIPVLLGLVTAPSIDAIEEAYERVQFQEAAELMDAYLQATEDPQERRSALVLAPTVYLSVDRVAAARAAARELLMREPTYTPPATASPKVLELFEEIRRAAAPASASQWYENTWLWTGVGVAVLGGLATWIAIERLDRTVQGDLGPWSF